MVLGWYDPTSADPFRIPTGPEGYRKLIGEIKRVGDASFVGVRHEEKKKQLWAEYVEDSPAIRAI